MPTTVHFQVNSAYQRMGKVSTAVSYLSEFALPDAPKAEAALLFWWPKSLSWLNLRVAQRTTPTDFQDNARHFELIAGAFGTSREKILEGRPTFLNENAFRIGSIRLGQAVQLEIEIDTDDPIFRQSAETPEARAAGEILQNIKFYLFDGRGTHGLNGEQGVVALVVKPAGRLPIYPGCVALDLGNTSCSMAALETGRYATRDLRVLAMDGVRPQLLHEGDSILSHVRFDRVYRWPNTASTAARPPAVGRVFPELPSDDSPLAVDWVIGQLAAVGTHKGLILGAKQLVASKDWEQVQKVQVKQEDIFQDRVVSRSDPVDVKNRAPAELLACRMLQAFSRSSRDNNDPPSGWPMRLAITYPTTYSPREIHRLRKTIYRAWLRMHFKSQTPREQPAGEARPSVGDPQIDRLADAVQRRLHAKNPQAGYDDPLIRLMLDEASAASVFFIYRKILEGAGGLETFRYYFPKGMNLLIYDCGGGTTDIALVNASVDGQDKTCLRIKVRGRTGVRHFGGDTITTAVCRLLKAKLCWELAKERQMEKMPSKPTLPGTPNAPGAAEKPIPPATRMAKRSELLTFIEAVEKRADREPNVLVPTRFDPQTFDEQSLLNREHMATLWSWAEKIKHKLEAAPSVQLKDLPLAIGPNQSKLAAAMLKGISTTAQKDVCDNLEKIAVHRWEIDALVGSQVARSVRNCNALIRNALIRDARTMLPDGGAVERPPEEEEYVHWVVISGNGSRYPFISELLREQLAILNLDQEGYFTHDPGNMKHAVAKGAALVLATAIGAPKIRVVFDTQMSECLPFEVGYKDLRINRHLILYAQQTPYERLVPRVVPLAEVHKDAAVPTELLEFTLLRRFPGDGEGRLDGDEVIPEESEMERGWLPYLTFRFDEPISGDLCVGYDLETHEFTVRAPNGEGKALEHSPGRPYRSPVQRGDI